MFAWKCSDGWFHNKYAIKSIIIIICLPRTVDRETTDFQSIHFHIISGFVNFHLIQFSDDKNVSLFQSWTMKNEWNFFFGFFFRPISHSLSLNCIMLSTSWLSDKRYFFFFSYCCFSVLGFCSMSCTYYLWIY